MFTEEALKCNFKNFFRFWLEGLANFLEKAPLSPFLRVQFDAFPKKRKKDFTGGNTFATSPNETFALCMQISIGFPHIPETKLVAASLDQYFATRILKKHPFFTGLIHHLQWYGLDVKLEVARRLMTFMFSRPDVPAQFARQIGWQDCLTRLLVKKILKPEMESNNVSLDGISIDDENVRAVDDRERESLDLAIWN